MTVTGLDGQTSLHRVADRGREGALNALIGLGAEINARDAKGRTPLHLASAKAKGKTSHNFVSSSFLILFANVDLILSLFAVSVIAGNYCGLSALPFES